MTMSERTGDAKRDGARVFGVIFQVLASLSLVGTLIATVKVVNLGADAGIDKTHDPFAWIVLVSGLFVTCVLTGIGYILGVLCAIYDRQDTLGSLSGTGPSQVPTPHVPESGRSIPNPIVTVGGDKHGPSSYVADSSATTHQPTTHPLGVVAVGKGALWESLTRDRHFKRSRPD
jgi:hypothetical protein